MDRYIYGRGLAMTDELKVAPTVWICPVVTDIALYTCSESRRRSVTQHRALVAKSLRRPAERSVDEGGLRPPPARPVFREPVSPAGDSQMTAYRGEGPPADRRPSAAAVQYRGRTDGTV